MQRQIEDSEHTTIKVYKKDAMMLNQILSMLKMRNVNMNQSAFMHELLSFAFEREKQFFREMQQWKTMQNEMEIMNKEMNQWMQIMFKYMGRM